MHFSIVAAASCPRFTLRELLRGICVGLLEDITAWLYDGLLLSFFSSIFSFRFFFFFFRALVGQCPMRPSTVNAFFAVRCAVPLCMITSATIVVLTFGTLVSEVGLHLITIHACVDMDVLFRFNCVGAGYSC